MRIVIRNSLLILSLAFLACGCGSDGDDPCQDVNCGDHGTCHPDSGACQCDAGYTGTSCEACAEGFVPVEDNCQEYEELEIAGSYTDDWDGTHDITDSSWTMGDSVFHISQFDNDQDFLIAQNDSANDYNLDLWSRFDWTFDGEDLYYCQAAFDAADEQTALAATGANRSDLAAGCGGFGWSKLN